MTSILPMKIILPSDIIGYFLNNSGQTGQEGFLTKFTHQARKLVNWRLKSADLTSSDYFLFSFAVLFTLFEYQNKRVCLRNLAKFLVNEFLPSHVLETLNLDFDSLFEKTFLFKEK